MAIKRYGVKPPCDGLGAKTWSFGRAGQRDARERDTPYSSENAAGGNEANNEGRSNRLREITEPKSTHPHGEPIHALLGSWIGDASCASRDHECPVGTNCPHPRLPAGVIRSPWPETGAPRSGTGGRAACVGPCVIHCNPRWTRTIPLPCGIVRPDSEPVSGNGRQ
ncbi:hypothetical protein GALL_199190 [mine drainage metagenome]|uniref:Uncharacterized protein n=1 Tax=mine drainage metagenome TaxID=410659 RepID=A0A1J5RPQ0_9ZZZZ